MEAQPVMLELRNYGTYFIYGQLSDLVSDVLSTSSNISNVIFVIKIINETPNPQCRLNTIFPNAWETGGSNPSTEGNFDGEKTKTVLTKSTKTCTIQLCLIT